MPVRDGPKSKDIGTYVAYLEDERSRGLPRGTAARLLRRPPCSRRSLVAGPVPSLPAGPTCACI
jgi:hypothetical protein